MPPELNFLTSSSKSARQPKLTDKAKAALDNDAETQKTARKRKTDGNRDHTNVDVVGKKARLGPGNDDGNTSTTTAAATKTVAATTAAAATKTVAATTTKSRKDDSTSVLTDNSDIEEIDAGSFNSDAKNETAQDELSAFSMSS
jgi:hypothetical protein